MLGVSTWVGYDLDGRTDITWSQSIALRLSEKVDALLRYKRQILEAINHENVGTICRKLQQEIEASQTDYQAFSAVTQSPDRLAKTANALTERQIN